MVGVRRRFLVAAPEGRIFAFSRFKRLNVEPAFMPFRVLFAVLNILAAYETLFS